MSNSGYFLAVAVTAIVLIAPQKAANAQAALALHCSEEADARGLHGVERKKFRSQCKAGTAETVTPTAVAPAPRIASKPAIESPPPLLPSKPANESREQKSA